MNMIWNFLKNKKYREPLFIVINMFIFAILGGIFAFFTLLLFPELLSPFMIYFIGIGYGTMLPGLLGGLIFLYRKV